MDLVFDVQHLKQSIYRRAESLNLYKEARLLFYPHIIRLELDQPRGPTLEVSCRRLDWQLDSMVRVCDQLSPFFTSIERFDLIWDSIVVVGGFTEPQGTDDMEPAQYLEIFQPFPAIRSLYVSKTLVPYIAPALKELIGESATEVLPNLRDLFLRGSATSRSIQEDIRPFIEARRLSGQPVAVHR
ncbi:hypothetical protein BC826DRAFT_998494 [Russula brevipes]|nr:hypothetical protein BC826DRAFT_998494 [Russula brevipes]